MRAEPGPAERPLRVSAGPRRGLAAAQRPRLRGGGAAARVWVARPGSGTAGPGPGRARLPAGREVPPARLVWPLVPVSQAGTASAGGWGCAGGALSRNGSFLFHRRRAPLPRVAKPLPGWPRPLRLSRET